MAGSMELLGLISKTSFESLMRASLQGGIFILLVWLLCRLVPRLPASVRCTLWWLASLKLLVAFVCVDPLPIPILTPPEPSQATSVGSFSYSAADSLPQLPGLRAAATPEPSDYHVSGLVVGVWAAIVLLLVATMAARIGKLARVAKRGLDAPQDLQKSVRGLSRSLGLPSPPALRFSNEIDTPLVLGLWKPTILVPGAAFQALQPEEQRMALCHELVHVQRRDLWLGHIPALAERLFFFHPLARLAVREYQLTREAACDAAVIERLGAQPRDYGRLLLALGVSRLPIPVAAAGSPSSYSKLKRRITMLRDISTHSPRLRTAGWAAILLAALALTPLTLVSRSQDRQAPAPAAAPVEPTKSVSPAPAPLQPAVPATPSQAKSPAKPTVSQAATGERHLRYVLFRDENGTMMSGSSDDVSRAQSFRKGNESMLWFRRDGREYVVRDPALLNDVEQIFRPLHEIGGDQAKLGAKQAAIGGRQSEIGNEQAVIGRKQAEIGARQARNGARQAAFAGREARDDKAQKQELENERRELEQEMKQLEFEMQELSTQMQKFNEPMSELSKEMNGLSEEMNVLSRKMQEASAKAEADMSRLLDHAISSGAATEVK